MATYYVRKDGNDTTGDGSTGTPWLTVAKALGANGVPIAGGHTLKIGTGTYAENGGSNFWSPTRAFVAEVIVEPENASANDVIITSTGGSAYTLLQANGALNNLKFRRITFQAAAGSTKVLTMYSGANSASSVTFEDCTFQSAQGGTVVDTSNGAANPVQTWTFTRCIFRQTGADTPAWQTGSGLSDAATLTFTDCVFDATKAACAFDEAAGGVTFTRCQFHGRGTSGYGLRLGTDAATNTGTLVGTVSGCVVRSASSHTLLIGAGCSGVTVEDSTLYGGDHGLVLKACTAPVIRRNLILSGTSTCIILKGSTGGTITGNRFAASGVTAIDNNDGAAGYENANNTITGNSIIASGYDAKAWDWDQAKDTGGNVIDANRYAIGSASTFGNVLGTNGIKTLAALRTAWGAESTNDDTSTEWTGVRFGWPTNPADVRAGVSNGDGGSGTGAAWGNWTNW